MTRLVSKVGRYQVNPTYSVSRQSDTKKIKNRDVRQHLFSNRVVPKENKLPEEVKEARTLNIFKTLQDSINIGQL